MRSVFLKVISDERRGGPFPPAIADACRAAYLLGAVSERLGLELELEMVDWQVLRVDVSDENAAVKLLLAVPYPEAFPP